MERLANCLLHVVCPRPSTAPGPGVCEWSPEGLYDKRASWIPNTDEILKSVKKILNLSDSTLSTPRPGAVERLGLPCSEQGCVYYTAGRTLCCNIELCWCYIVAVTLSCAGVTL